MPERAESPLRPDPLTTALLVGIGGLLVAHAIHLSGVAEDAYITFRFAQNWTAGHGIVWNPGEAPVEGYTNFLWLVVSALLLLSGADVATGSQMIGVLASLGTLWLCHRCGMLLGWSPRFALLPPLALALSGPFATWSAAGMETSFFTFWLLVAAHSLARFWQARRAGSLHTCAAALLFASLTRPEGVLIAGLLLGLALATAWKEGDPKPEVLALSALPWAALFLVWIGWRWLYFGYPLPNTYYAKTGGGPAQLARGVGYVWLFSLHFLAPWLGVVLLALGGRGRAPEPSAPSATLLLRSCLLITGTYTLYIAAVGGDYMAMYRFFVPVLPFLYLLLGWLAFRAGATQTRRGWVMAAVTIGLAGSLVHSTAWESSLFAKPEHMHGNFRGVETERWHVARNQLIGRFFARHGAPGESIATRAIGAIGFYSGLAVYDVHGIVDPHIAHLDRDPDGSPAGLAGHEKSDYRYIFDKRPTFYVFNPKLRQRPFPGIPALDDSVNERVSREYRIRSVRLDDPVNGESGYFSFLERKDRGNAAP